MPRGKHRKKRAIPATAAVVVPVAIVLVATTGDGVQLPGMTGVQAVPPELSVPVPASLSVLAVDGSMPTDPNLSPALVDAVVEGQDVPAPQWPTVDLDLTEADMPEVAKLAYARAEQLLRATQPGCKVRWTVLAAIGRVESDHAAGGAVDATGRTLTPILGPVLDGTGTAQVADTDHGRWDGDDQWDRAVGPMQFIPATWETYGVDGSGDGTADPNNLYDAAATAARFLCAGGTDMSNPMDAARAIFRYNHSDDYVRSVLTMTTTYDRGVTQPPTLIPPPNPASPPPGVDVRAGAVHDPGAVLSAAGSTVAPQAGKLPGVNVPPVAVPPVTVPVAPGVQVPGVQLPGVQVPGVQLPGATQPTTVPKPPVTTTKPPVQTTTPKPPATTTKPPVQTTTPKPPATTTKPPATTTTRPPLPGTDWYDWTVWVPWIR
ncbi:lytic transglycosylase domain-containing protein [Actinokineospora bangkokensis]|uniref:Transglycosylase SLT domain-containing protein n=1 Tax=Actinokineospora bangkokensis TaxID=1193682 RepID=A0A1Q9LQ98_9PSEU|nr:lytic transglycosylase domain-containing protein [Actinokineospora bangkokensis]OLR94163.1 hypothetical protein BJP25_10175 [Actinokineospora bangkokensis]